MAVATLTSKGQITIPKSVRDALNLQPGDRIEFLVDDAGHVAIVPVTHDIKSLKGMLPKPARSVSVDEMNRVIRKRKG